MSAMYCAILRTNTEQRKGGGREEGRKGGGREGGREVGKGK